MENFRKTKKMTTKCGDRPIMIFIRRRASMQKRIFILLIVVALLFSSTAFATITNRDMQLMGGVLVSNANDSFFFAPMEPGLTAHWGLYALSSCAEGPMVEFSSGYPARLVHADNEKVYFLGYTDANRSVHALYEVDIATKQANATPLLSNIASAFVEKDDTFLYVSTDDPYMLCRYSIKDRQSTDLKSMQSSKKTMYDAAVYDNKVYFLTKSESGTEDIYLLNSNGKATSVDKPNPEAYSSVLHEGYRIYANDKLATKVYSVKIGNKKGNQLGANYGTALFNPRFGTMMYQYNGETNQIVGMPLDGSSEKTITLESEATLTRLVMGGSKDELYYYYSGAVYSVKPDLSSQTKLFNFDSTIGGTTISYVVPAGDNVMMVMGYNQETTTNARNLMPTNVYAYNRADGSMIFGYPTSDDQIKTIEFGVDPIGDVPVPESEDGESYFVF